MTEIERRRREVDALVDTSAELVGLLEEEREMQVRFARENSHLRQTLLELADAADAFLAQPPPQMPSHKSFYQLTTAADCRELTLAYRKTRELLATEPLASAKAKET